MAGDSIFFRFMCMRVYQTVCSAFFAAPHHICFYGIRFFKLSSIYLYFYGCVCGLFLLPDKIVEDTKLVFSPRINGNFFAIKPIFLPLFSCFKYYIEIISNSKNNFIDQ